MIFGVAITPQAPKNNGLVNRSMGSIYFKNWNVVYFSSLSILTVTAYKTKVKTASILGRVFVRYRQ
jgi:hypothetical protein